MSEKFARRVGFSWIGIGAQSFGTEMTLEDLDESIGYVNAAQEAAVKRAVEDERSQFKNFHRSLSIRFGFPHDEKDWKRDQISLEEHIADLIRKLPAIGAIP